MKTLHPEDIKKNQWIVLVDKKIRQPVLPAMEQFAGHSPLPVAIQVSTPEFHGVPGKVACVDLPFIICQSIDQKIYTFDVRVDVVASASKAYVQIFIDAVQAHTKKSIFHS